MMMMASGVWVRGESRTLMDPGFRACFCADDRSREMIKRIAGNLDAAGCVPLDVCFQENCW